MKAKIKWILLGIVTVIVVVVIYFVSLTRVANQHASMLEGYALSIEGLPEVDRVLDVHQFNGLESYIVSRVRLHDGQEIYYFVRDEVVQHYLPQSDLIREEQARQIAYDTIASALGEASGSQEIEFFLIQVGVLEDVIIFELQARVDEDVHYVIMDGQTGEVILHFNA